jgi:hypothetical protein
MRRLEENPGTYTGKKKRKAPVFIRFNPPLHHIVDKKKDKKKKSQQKSQPV